MQRRNFIRITGFGIVSAMSFSKLNTFAQDANNSENKRILSKIIQKADVNNWQQLDIGDLMMKVAEEFRGTPYVGGTLEGEPEMCRVDLSGMDCVTFYEYCLCIARMIKLGKSDLQELINELTYVRYRDGVLGDYSTRLHYTSDWIDNNVKKFIVKDITKEIGGELFNFNVDFMSNHPQYYPALKNDPEMVRKIAKIEEEINSRQHYYIPREKVKRTEQFLQNGDIIALATDKKGLDYAHTGLAYVQQDYQARLFHASSKQKKVMLDVRLYQYIANIKSDIGITVARPIFNL
jgi:hypothetical protein